MSANARLLSVAVLLVLVFAGVASVAGYPGDLSPGQDDDPTHSGAARHAGGDERAGTGAPSAEGLPGVQVAQHGLRLAVTRSRIPLGASRQPFSFRVLDGGGRPVRDFEVAHERRMHLIVVRRDLDGFRHLHPTMKRDGTWTTEVDFGEGGTYRVFADFTRDGQQRTLGSDVQVGGPFRPRPLPAPERVVRSDGGLNVVLRAGAASSGEDARVEFEVRDGRQAVTDRVEPYLGAKGHLVALREGDLAYLHTHPETDEPAFTVKYPSAGRYRLFAQVRYRGRVHTAAFTQEVGR